MISLGHLDPTVPEADPPEMRIVLLFLNLLNQVSATHMKEPCP